MRKRKRREGGRGQLSHGANTVLDKEPKKTERMASIYNSAVIKSLSQISYN